LEPRILSRNFVRTNTRLEKDDIEKKTNLKSNISVSPNVENY
jgi:hypothetical protein